jgi:4'-phosphopantetheinyl transferase
MNRVVEMPFLFTGDAVHTVALPAADEVHLWRVDLDQWADATAAGADELPPAERERARRFVFETHRRRYVAGRWWLRGVLGSYLDRAPRDIGFLTGVHGKPRLQPAADNHGLCFNLAHCGAAALLAVTVHCDVGVDLEQPLPDEAWPAVARRCLCAEELAALETFPPGARSLAFAQTWTRKEAVGKALGFGLSPEIISRAVGPAAWGIVRSRDDAFAVWSLPERAGLAAAVAVADPRGGEIPGLASVCDVRCNRGATHEFRETQEHARATRTAHRGREETRRA